MIEWDRTPALPLPDRETAIKIFSGHPLVSSVGEIPARIIAAANELKVLRAPLYGALSFKC